MLRVRFLKDFEFYRSGQTARLPQNKAKFLIKHGIAVFNKDITEHDLKVK